MYDRLDPSLKRENIVQQLSQVEKKKQLCLLIIQKIQELPVHFSPFLTTEAVDNQEQLVFIKIDGLATSAKPPIAYKEQFANVFAAKKDEIAAKAEARRQEIKANQTLFKFAEIVEKFTFSFAGKCTIEEIVLHELHLKMELINTQKNNERTQEFVGARGVLGSTQCETNIYEIISKKERFIEQQAHQQKERLQLLTQINFDLHFENFTKKMEYFLEEEKNPDYVEAAKAAAKLCQSLTTAKELFLNSPNNIKAKRQFKESCQKAIRDAKLSDLQHHRQWRGIFMKFLIDLLCLTNTQLGIFAKTHSLQLVESFEKDVEEKVRVELAL